MSETAAIEDIPAVEPIAEEPVEEGEAVVEEILGEPDAPTEETEPPVDDPSVEEPPVEEPPVEEPPVEEPPVEESAADEPTADDSTVEEPNADMPAAEETTADDTDVPAEQSEVPTNEPEASASEPEVPAEDQAAPVADLTAGAAKSQSAESATDPSSSQVAIAMAAQDPEAAPLLETEQAIERAIASPEAPASQTILEPGQNVSTPDLPIGLAAHLKQGAKDSQDKAKAKADNAIAATIPGPTPPAAPTNSAVSGAPSVVSKKSRKIRNIKAKVGRSVLPKVLRIGVPKEVIPLVTLLRHKKKNGEDVDKLVQMCIAALGA